MNALGRYVLTSLWFVFAAMAEFTFVLFMKQNQEWLRKTEKGSPIGEKSDEIHTQRVNNPSKALFEGGQVATKVGNLEETMDHEKSQLSFRSRKCTLIRSLALTTKLDLAGFILFHVSYMIYNFLYCPGYFN